MKKARLAFVIAAIFLCLGQANQCAAGAYAYVTDMAADQVFAVRLSDQDVTIIDVGDAPVGLAISPDGDDAYVTNYNGGNVSIIRGNCLFDNVRVGNLPVGVAVSPNNDFLFVANRDGKTISVISVTKIDSYIENDMLEPGISHVPTINVGSAPVSVAVSPNGKHVYVANSGDDTVSVLSLEDIDSYMEDDMLEPDISHVPTINVGNAPWGLAISPDNDNVFVANRDDNTISVIAVTKIDSYMEDDMLEPGISHVPTINVGNAPIGIAVSPTDGSLVYVANRDSATMSFIEINETEPAASTVISIDSGGKQPYSIAVTPDNSKVYVANYGDARGEGTVTFSETAFSALSGVSQLDIAATNRLLGLGMVSISVPEAPTELAGTAMSDTQVDLSWTDHSLDEIGFKVERKKGAGGTYTEIDKVDANQTIFTDLDLEPYTTYHYQIRAYNDHGDSAYTEEINIRTHARLTAPTNLVATTASHTQIDLSWTDTSIGESGFKVEMKKTSDDQTESTTDSGQSWEEVGEVGPNVTGCSIGDLERNTDYSFRVRAYINSAEAVEKLGALSAVTESEYSNEAQEDTSNSPCFITTAASDFPAAPVKNIVASAICISSLILLLVVFPFFSEKHGTRSIER